jgi:hypothetical protein
MSTLDAADVPSGQIELPSARSLAGLARLYSTLVAYGLAYLFVYAELIVPIYGAFMRYVAFDASRLAEYLAIVFIAPMAMLPIGTRLRTPGQMIYGTVCVWSFIPIPIHFLAQVPEGEFWTVFAVLWFGSLLLALASRKRFKVEVRPLSVVRYRQYSTSIVIFLCLGTLLATQWNFTLVTLDDASRVRGDIQIPGLLGYVLFPYMNCFGALGVATAIAFRRYWLGALAVVNFVITFGVITAKAAVLAPPWLLYFALASRYFIKDSIVRFLLVMMAPFLSTSLIWLAARDTLEPGLLKTAAYGFFMWIGGRLFTIPQAAFSVYHDFFLTHQYTYWSHINVVSWIVEYPYAQPMPVVLQNTYGLGNYNAGFIMTDGLQAAGVAGIGLACLAVAGVIIALNSAAAGLGMRYLAVALCTALIGVNDISFATWLVTGGIAPMFLLFLYAPRGAESPVSQAFEASAGASELRAKAGVRP